MKKIYCFAMLLCCCMISACATVDPNKVTVALQPTPPEAKITSFTEGLKNLGLMSQIYETGVVKIQSNPIGDNTGTSISTGGEVPRDITEMIKSSLNSIGGNVIFIPYDPAFISNQINTGYSDFKNKMIPDVVISGGITEFDRGLSTTGENTNASVGGEISGLPGAFPSQNVGLRYGDGAKRGLARITLDFNLLDFKTLAGIARMNTVNSMEVHKAVREKELGISIFGQSFGRKGSIRKVEGRHNAVRLLVELSMIQMVGKYLGLPFWRLLGEDALPDPDVLAAIKKFYYTLNDAEHIYYTQEWLYLSNFDVTRTGTLDPQTISAIKTYNPNFNPASNNIDVDTFTKVYTSIPISQEALSKRNRLAKLDQQNQAVVQDTVSSEPQPEAAPASAYTPSPVPEKQPAQPSYSEPAVPQPTQTPTISKRKSGTIGRILTDEEW